MIYILDIFCGIVLHSIRQDLNLILLRHNIILYSYIFLGSEEIFKSEPNFNSFEVFDIVVKFRIYQVFNLSSFHFKGILFLQLGFIIVPFEISRTEQIFVTARKDIRSV